MHARYYNPNLGRFLSVDPVGGKVGSSQSWNRYSYVLNNPVRLFDPAGMKEFEDEDDELQRVLAGEDVALSLLRDVQRKAAPLEESIGARL